MCVDPIITIRLVKCNQNYIQRASFYAFYKAGDDMIRSKHVAALCKEIYSLQMKQLCPTALFTALYYCITLSTGGNRN